MSNYEKIIICILLSIATGMSMWEDYRLDHGQDSILHYKTKGQ